MSDDIDRSNWTEQDYQAERVGQQLTEIATGHPAPPPPAPPVPEPPPPPSATVDWWHSFGVRGPFMDPRMVVAIFIVFLFAVAAGIFLIYQALSEPGPSEAAPPAPDQSAEAPNLAGAEESGAAGDAGLPGGEAPAAGEPDSAEGVAGQTDQPGQGAVGAGNQIEAAAGVYRLWEASVALALMDKIDRLESAAGSITIDRGGRVVGSFVFVYWGTFQEDTPARMTTEYTLESPGGLSEGDGGLAFEGTVTGSIVLEVTDWEEPGRSEVVFPVIGRIVSGSDLLQLTLTDDAGFEFAVEFQR